MLDGAFQTDIEAAVNQLDDLASDMTAGMGAPVPDEGTADAGGDDRIDVYLLDVVPHRQPAAANGTALAAVVPTGPVIDGTRSSYLLVGRPRARDADDLRRAVAHQFFHSLQYAHNYATLTVDPARTPWFYEASAAWAERHFHQADSGPVQAYFANVFRNIPGVMLELPIRGRVLRDHRQPPAREQLGHP